MRKRRPFVLWSVMGRMRDCSRKSAALTGFEGTSRSSAFVHSSCISSFEAVERPFNSLLLGQRTCQIRIRIWHSPVTEGRVACGSLPFLQQQLMPPWWYGRYVRTTNRSSALTGR